MISASQPRILALAPEGAEGIGVAAAACRARSIGIVDLGASSAAAVSEAITRLTRLTQNPFAIRVGATQLADAQLVAFLATVPWVIVRIDSGAELGPAIRKISARGSAVITEIVSRDQVAAAVSAGAAGLIVAGNEAGGWCGADSSFVLLQSVLSASDLPVWVRGGIGPRVAGGCMAMGAAGVVVEGALLLARESPLEHSWRERLSRWDGSETSVITSWSGDRLRVFAPPGSPAIERLRDAAEREGAEWESARRSVVGWKPGQCPPVGPDAAFAAQYARKFVTVGGIIQAFDRAMADGIASAREVRPLDEGSSLARDHGTRYPILQGPMTRVSDVPEFAEAVAGEGGLPFLALAMLRRQEVHALLKEASAMLAGKPWGVGILGFVPPELRAEQMAAVLEFRPPFALIAGGRPDQAAGLEAEGIATFLHVPSPGLLDQYLRAGSRRFVLEGRECGGHVGPRSSFVLWEQACQVVSDAIDRGLAAGEVSLVFAGGIHDARSAAFVSALSAPLAARGAKIGVLIGTAYLFTEEAVRTGAIVPRFQDEVLRCGETVLLESGPGHQVRVSRTPFVDRFEEERKRLIAEKRSPEEIREALEALNVGRLRVATKGFDRREEAGGALVAVDDQYQAHHGLYMLGQVAALRNRTTTMAALHREITTGAGEFLDRGAEAAGGLGGSESPPTPSDIAIIGMASVFPNAENVRKFWSNTLAGVDSIVEIPPDRWDWRLYYDADPKAPDKIVSKWGGFLPDIPFDPLRYGMPPSSLPSIEPAQLVALEVVRNALADAGYAERPFPRERTGVVLGMGGGAAQLAMGYAFRSYLPMLDAATGQDLSHAIDSCDGLLPEWTEDSFPGFLLNVTAGRIANRFNLGGSNYTVDAACGSSLAAAALAVRELETGSADMVILGGVDTVQNPFTYLAFSKTQAFSPRGRCRPFDASADGIVISEGVAALVLKRLADAERDGDRIYAVIKGVGASSDGRARGLTAPSVEGQTRALERAYKKAGVSPASVGYVEAHGTGTSLGDVVEIEALGRLFRESGVGNRECALGSVKSLIGHTKCAAGLAGLINASLALHHQVIPPTIGIETPNAKLEQPDAPFRVCSTAQPWLHSNAEEPRRAGVSAFGFGGTNFHAVLEAYEGNLGGPAEPALLDWPVELLVWHGDTPRHLVDQIDSLTQSLESGARPRLRDLAHALIQISEAARGTSRPTLTILAATLDELREKLELARASINEGRPTFEDPRGVYYAAAPAWAGQPVAFLFPGQGAQAPGMLRELALVFPEVRASFEEFDRVLTREKGLPIGPLVFPPPAFDDRAREQARNDLMQTEVAQPAIGAACVGMLRLLGAFGCEPAMVAGHSYGELVALHAAGALSVPALAELSRERGRLMRDAGRGVPGAMAAVMGGPEVVESLLADAPGTQVANWNGPRQTVIAGPTDAIKKAVELATARQIQAKVLPVSSAFHTPLVADAAEPLTRFAASRITAIPDRPVYSNLDQASHPADPKVISNRLGAHLAGPVRFAGMIEAMYENGARVFVEVGPGSVLTSLVSSVLRDRPHLAVATDSSSAPGIPALLRAIARLVVAGLPLRLERVTAGRSTVKLDLRKLPTGDGGEPLTASTWIVNGSRARPHQGPEPRRLGMAGVSAVTTPEASPNRKAPVSVTAIDSKTPPPARASASARPAMNSRLAAALPRSPASAPLTRQNGRTEVPMSNKQAPSPVAHTDPVIESFQRTMQMFLEVQQSTMLAYLTGQASAPAAPAGPQERPAAEAHFTAKNTAVAAPPSARAVPVSTPRPSSNHASNGFTAYPAPAPSKSAGTNGKHEDTAQNDRQNLPDRATITERLLETVRDRTGYPLETLGLDLDMEADLGIDSIKRVEILGKLRDEFPTLKGLSDSADAMDALSQARTLGAIVDRMAALAERTTSRAAEKKGAPGSNGSISGASHHEVRVPERAPLRRLLSVVDAPLPRQRSQPVPGGRILITDDARGVAQTLSDRLEAAGFVVDRIGGGDQPIDWTSPGAVDEALKYSRANGRIAGIVHTLALPSERAGVSAAHADWEERIGTELKGLFLLAKATAPDLEKAALEGGACLIAATSLGGRFASAGSQNPEFFAGHGGIAGLVKTLAREWRGVHCRVVDFAGSDPADQIAGRLLDEMLVHDGWAEVGYEGERRIRLQTAVTPIVRGNSRIELEPGDPVVITGGARGITALVATELARTWKPTLLILGTSPTPEGSEAPDTKGLVAEAEIKKALLARLKREGRPAGPAEIEAAYQSLRRAREVRDNLEILRQAGATVAYSQTDVRDPAALARVMIDWKARHGDPVGLIHGAGLIKDKLIRHKTVESFDRVLGTKLEGALNLVGMVNPERLKFTALFSSIAGRFGNAGQSDYAAANDILNKLAQWLDRRWPGRVVSMIWGPWSGIGMVSQLENHLGRQGLGMISPEIGRSLLIDELRFGKKGDVEVIYSGELGSLEQPIPEELVARSLETVS